MSHRYDIIKLLSKYTICDSGVFIPVSSGINNVQIDQVMPEL